MDCTFRVILYVCCKFNYFGEICNFFSLSGAECFLCWNGAYILSCSGVLIKGTFLKYVFNSKFMVNISHLGLSSLCIRWDWISLVGPIRTLLTMVFLCRVSFVCGFDHFLVDGFIWLILLCMLHCFPIGFATENETWLLRHELHTMASYVMCGYRFISEYLAVSLANSSESSLPKMSTWDGFYMSLMVFFDFKIVFWIFWVRLYNNIGYYRLYNKANYYYYIINRVFSESIYVNQSK